MSKVLVLDTTRQPLNPVHPGRARLLLASGKAAVFRRYPFTLILKRVVEHPEVPPLRLKIDPGSQTSGMALVHDPSGAVVWAAELTHRGTRDQARGFPTAGRPPGQEATQDQVPPAPLP